MAEKNKHDDLDQRIPWLVELVWNDQRARIPSGDFPGAEDYLKKFPELGTNKEAAVDVIYNEFVVCKDCGLSVDEGKFCARFPDFAVLIERQFCLARGITTDSHNDRTGSANDNAVESVADSESPTRPFFETRSRTPENRLSPETGNRNIGRYQIGPEIGRGSFAIVHKAWDPQLNRILAIKLPRPELVESPNLKKRMLREARSAAQLYHPAIVSVHEIGEHEGAPFILTDFVDGVTMEERLSTSPPSQMEAVSWTATIADALHYAHQNGIIHRDIKPANILIRNDGQVLLTDFGLARLADSAGSITTHGDIIGTPSYMSPEQAEGRNTVDFRSDIFSLGVVLYRCLAGKLPFDGPVSTILHRVIHDPIESVSSGGRLVPRDLQTIILKCLAKHPDDRYRSARELASDLNCFLAGEPISARAVGLAERMFKYARRRPRITALIVATMVLLGFVAGGAIQLANVMQQRDRARTAELQSQTLTASSNYDAGLLAKQQGKLSVAIGQLNSQVIFDLATQFQARYWSLVKKRRWHFPPRIARHFADLPGFSNEPLAEDRDSVSERVIALAEAHPESSLLTLAARTCIDVGQPGVVDLEQARELFQSALEYPAFLHDAHHHARIGIYATSVQLALVKGYQVEQNTQCFVDAAAAIDPDSITRSGRLRTITLTLINANEWELAEQWSRRWSVLETQTRTQTIDALWHYGIVLEKKQRWLDLIAVCDKLLELDPTMKLAQDFRTGALYELKNIVESEDRTGGG